MSQLHQADPEQTGAVPNDSQTPFDNSAVEPVSENTELEAAVVLETRCGHCGKEYAEPKKHCPNCGYPMNGSVEERDTFAHRIGFKKLELEEADKKIRSAKVYMYVLAGLMVFAGLVFYYTTQDMGTLIVYLILSGVYVMLAIWSKTKPFAAILTGLILFVTIQLLSAVLEPESIYKGIIIKVLVIAALVKGARSAYEAERIRREHNL